MHERIKQKINKKEIPLDQTRSDILYAFVVMFLFGGFVAGLALCMNGLLRVTTTQMAII